MAESPQDGANGPLGWVLKINGSEIPDRTMIQSIRVSRDLGRIPSATVSILGDASQIADFDEIDDDAFKIGGKIEISGLWSDGPAQEIFQGVIMSMRLRVDAQVGQVLELTCRDKALALMEVRTSGQYLQQRDSDVMTALIQDAGLKAEVAQTALTHDQIYAGASAWDVMRLLADRNGFVIDVYAGSVKVFAPQISKAAKLKVSFGVDLLEFDAHINAQRMIAGAGYSAWDTATQTLQEGENETLTQPTLGNISADDIAGVLNNRKMVTLTGAVMESATLSGLASARLLRASLDAVSGTCSYIGSNLAGPGDMIEIHDCGDRFSGKGLISGVVHTIDTGVWTTKVRLGLPLDWVSDGHNLASPGAGAITTPMSGLQIGKVLQVHDDPDGLERIKISLPAIGAQGAQVWARIGTPYATADAGIQFLPEVDDEVLVGFLSDDPNAPIILGALHNPLAKRPEVATAENFTKKIITKGKLAVTFDDEKKILKVETPGGHEITLDDDTKSISLSDSGGSSVTLDDGGITLKTDGDITLDAGGKVTVTAKGDATLSGANVTCEGDIGFTGKGGSQAEVSAGGQTTVAGGIVKIN